MTSNFVKFLMIAHEAGMLSLMEDEHVRSYSGRGMYGSHCPGITCPDTHSTLMRLCEAAESLTGNHDDSHEDHPTRPVEIFKMSEVTKDRVRTDSMGRDDMILYFPGVNWDQEEYNKFYQDEVGAFPEE